MVQSQDLISSLLIYYRLIALWILCEAVLGGIIHGFRLPISGLVVGSSAITCICLIAWFNPSKGAIFRATIIVAIFKMMLSPQAPPTAYVAVFFQGLLAEALFWNRKHFRLICIVFAVIALLESAFQRILVVTIVYGNDIWSSTNEFIARMFPKSKGTNYSYIFAFAYVVMHLLSGVLVGLLAGLIPFRYKKWPKPGLSAAISTGLQIPMAKKKRPRIILIAVWCILIFLLVQASFGPGEPILPSNVSFRIFVRSIIIVLAWFLIVSPLLKLVLNRWLEKKKRRSSEDIKQLIDLLPRMRTLVTESWSQTRKGKWYERTNKFIKTVIAGTLNDGEHGKIYILTGEIGSGKTTALSAWVKTLEDVGGILTPQVNGRRVFLNISNGSEFQMESDESHADSLVVGRYKFSKQSFLQAAQVIETSIKQNTWTIIDEVGPLELKGEGFYFQVINALENASNIILVVRDSLVEEIELFFGIENAIIVRIDDLKKIR